MSLALLMSIAFLGPNVKKYSLHMYTFYYIPLFESLSRLLEKSEVRNEIETPRINHDAKVLKDFCDGSIMNDHPLFKSDKKALQIIAYFDEVEVVNPIGSYVNTHNLGCLFFTLGNIRPSYRSSLKAIYLVSVARVQDIKNYGIDVFLRPFVDELKSLYADGLSIIVGASEQHYYGGLVAFLADTLAAHQVGGFKGSMSFARRICRSCIATRVKSQTLFDENLFEIRTPEKHEQQCQSLD